MSGSRYGTVSAQTQLIEEIICHKLNEPPCQVLLRQAKQFSLSRGAYELLTWSFLPPRLDAFVVRSSDTDFVE